MAKFKVTVTRIDVYEIDFNDNIIDQDFIDEYSRYFATVRGQEEMAEILATMKARLDPHDNYFEGFGYIKVNNRHQIPEARKKGNEGININVISEDKHIICTSELMKRKEESCTHQ